VANKRLNGSARAPRLAGLASSAVPCAHRTLVDLAPRRAAPSSPRRLMVKTTNVIAPWRKRAVSRRLKTDVAVAAHGRATIGLAAPPRGDLRAWPGSNGSPCTELIRRARNVARRCRCDEHEPAPASTGRRARVSLRAHRSAASASTPVNGLFSEVRRDAGPRDPPRCPSKAQPSARWPSAPGSTEGAHRARAANRPGRSAGSRGSAASRYR